MDYDGFYIVRDNLVNLCDISQTKVDRELGGEHTVAAFGTAGSGIERNHWTF